MSRPQIKLEGVRTKNADAKCVENSKRVQSGNTTITNCRQTHGIVMKSHATITRHQEDKKQSNQLSLLRQDDCKTRIDTK